MVRRERGFTLIEILVVITIIAMLAGLVAALAPKMIAKGKQTTCTNNLAQIGGLLKAAELERKIKNYSGAAFLLQVKEELTNDLLKVFICPGEDVAGDEERPEEGSQEFIDMYRSGLELPAGVEGRHSSYAGPERWQAPKSGDAKFETWLWGCDRCRGGATHHPDGLVVLFNNASVSFLDLKHLTGVDEENGIIEVGANSGDPRLARMRFFPDR